MVSLTLSFVFGLMTVLAAGVLRPSKIILLVGCVYLLTSLTLLSAMIFLQDSKGLVGFIDDGRYGSVVTDAAEPAASSISIDVFAPDGKNKGYYWLAATLGKITGGDQHTLQAFNILIGLVTIFWLVRYHSYLNISNSVTLYCLAIVAFLPDVRFWTVLAFKDSLVCAFVILSMVALHRRNWILAAIAILALSTVRFESAAIFALLVIYTNKHSWKYSLVAFGLVSLLIIASPDSGYLIILGGSAVTEAGWGLNFIELLNISPDREFSTGFLGAVSISSVFDLWKFPAAYFFYFTIPFEFALDHPDSLVRLYNKLVFPVQVMSVMTFLLFVRNWRLILKWFDSKSVMFIPAAYFLVESVIGTIFMWELMPSRHRLVSVVILLGILLPRVATESRLSSSTAVFFGLVSALLVLGLYALYAAVS